MHDILGQALSEFDTAVREFREALAFDPPLRDTVFADTSGWANLLTYKLVPHLAGEGCLIAAVAGGTNSGKSTVFNTLLGAAISPVVPTAAATRHPVIAAHPDRARQCLEGKLVPEFKPAPWKAPGDALADGQPDGRLFVAAREGLGNRLALLDTPDIDSIEKRHWAVAEHIRAAGDVVIAVLTGEKYRDERVVDFFRDALASGRMVVPLMNKADPSGDFAIARRQLDEFRADVATEAPAFLLPLRIGDTEACSTIRSADGVTDLRTYLEELDVPAIKHRVYRDTVAHFAEAATEFLERAEQMGAVLKGVADEFEGRATAFAARYDPAPGAAVGGLFHEFVQRKRGAVRRLIGATSGAVARGVTAVAKTVTGAFHKRGTLDTAHEPCSDAELRTVHQEAIENITRDLARSYVESSRNLREPAAHLLIGAFDTLDVDEALRAVITDVLRTASVSEDFRRHANLTLEAWWSDHKGKRRALEALDTLLAAVPAAIAAPISIYTGGVGVPEAMVFAGPIVEQFVARVIEFQFGDAMFDFLSPWKAEQQQTLADALRRRLIRPKMEALERARAPFEGDLLDKLRRCHEQCRQES